MATGGSDDSQVLGNEDGGNPPKVRCPSCNKYTPLWCEKCGQGEACPKVIVGKVENMSIIGHQVTIGRHFTDYSRGARDDVSCMLGRSSSSGNVYVKKMKVMPITLRQTVINLGSEEGHVNISMAADSEQMKEASDGVFMLKSNWSSSTQGEHPGRTEVLATQIINQLTDDFFLKILSEIHQEEAPASVIQNLYKTFNLRLLGLTKSLEFLMEVEAERGKEMMGREREIQDVLAQFVPAEHRPDVTWRCFSRIPVQCGDDAPLSPVQDDVFEVEAPTVDSRETVTGALCLACQYGNSLTCQRLLEHRNADVRRWNQEGLSPFHVACQYGQSHLLGILLQAGALMHEPDENGWFPLHHACGPLIEEGDRRLRTVQWLVDHNADVSQRNHEGHTALDLAERHNYDRTVSLLRQYNP